VIDAEQLYAEMARGATVVTTTTRLSRSVTHDYEQWKLAAAEAVWETPDVIPWSSWIHRTWEQAVVAGALAPPKLLLSAEQERQVWRGIIDGSPSGSALLRLDAAAAQVQDAWALIRTWRIDAMDPEFSGNLDSEALADWLRAFDALCRSRGWLSLTRLPEQLLQTLQTGGFRIPDPLVFIDFDEFTPLQSALIGAIDASGGDLRRVGLAPRRGSAVCLECADWRAEIRAVSLWARQRLAGDRTSSIGIVVPELAAVRNALSHALDEVLAPELLMPGAGELSKPYNISLGQPLARYAVVRSALYLLAVPTGDRQLEEMSVLLRSPFIAGWLEEAGPRALLDRRLREDRQTAVGLGRVIYLAGQKDKPWFCPLLAGRLEKLRRLIQQQPRAAEPGTWSHLFASLLAEAGWAAGRPLSSEEFQTVEAWRKLLSSLASLSSVVPPVDRQRALKLLENLASERLFQAQSGQTQVQVLGLYEAMGLQFDCLWVMGLHEAAWPPRANPHPYLPLSLQRRLKLPHASAERELQVAEMLTRRLLSSADEVVVSYPLQGERSEQLGPSPLIAGLKSVGQSGLELWGDPGWAALVAAQRQLDRLSQDQAPAVEQEAVRGGSGLFKAQAACPFKAFAEFRLAARPFARSEPGLDAMARGSLIHRALELVWESLESHRHLLAQMHSGALDETIRIATGRALEELGQVFAPVMTARFREIESGRVQRQLRQWLQIEGDRPPFTVLGREVSYTPEIGGIQVKLTVDRIDQLPDGRRILIDYKTGSVQPTQWFGERPEEPQLPLYSAVVEGEKAAVLFAQIRAGENQFKGVVAEQGLIPGLPPSRGSQQLKESTETWPRVIGEWSENMTRLAQDFRAGEALVDPKAQPDSCSYCELAALCRIDEQNGLRAQNSTAEED